MITRKDVAKLAGVSSTSVSYFVNKSGYVSEEKEEKIAKAIKALNYRPNLIAKSLRIKTSNQLVMICNEIRNSFHSELVYRTTKLAYQKGYTMLFCNVIDDSNYIEKICSYQVNGVFIVTNKLAPEQINKIANMNIPTVTLTNMEWNNLNESISEIKIDVYTAMRKLVRYIIAKGHTKIAYISNCPAAKYKYIDQRTHGFFDEIKANHLDSKHINIIYNITNASMAREVVKENFSYDEHPTAYLCGNDTAAIGVLRAMYELGLKVPDDVVVTGFDNSEISRISIPSLTTIDMFVNQLGEIMLNVMLDKINGKKANNTIIEPQLILRDSTENNIDASLGR
ncbi:MAG TPA: LacI family transcriptional regulator [Firmicutes bacterium]|jgi:DNA-binding LacI/PurR family transcriptional regulator|nr:LacI family transcriptional regulator [Bacillota bacterium]